MYFKIKKANGQKLFLAVKIDRDKWNTIEEESLITLIDDVKCKSLQSKKNRTPANMNGQSSFTQN